MGHREARNSKIKFLDSLVAIGYTLYPSSMYNPNSIWTSKKKEAPMSVPVSDIRKTTIPVGVEVKPPAAPLTLTGCRGL